MRDRSEEVTTDREPVSTDDLLEETESLLSESGNTRSPATDEGETGTGGSSPAAHEDLSTVRAPDRESAEGAAGAEPEDQAADVGNARWNLLRRGPSPAAYFSAKAFAGLVVVFVLAMLAAGSFVPFVGGSVGLFAAAFLVGLIGSTRRYLEVTTAGTGVALGAATMDYALIALLGGGLLLGISTAIGATAAVAGYYFGRDLRAGLTREI